MRGLSALIQIDYEYDYGRDGKRNLGALLVLFDFVGFFPLFMSKENPILFSYVFPFCLFIV